MIKEYIYNLDTQTVLYWWDYWQIMFVGIFMRFETVHFPMTLFIIYILQIESSTNNVVGVFPRGLKLFTYQWNFSLCILQAKSLTNNIHQYIPERFGIVHFLMAQFIFLIIDRITDEPKSHQWYLRGFLKISIKGYRRNHWWKY
jgi:hypothetical protein